MTIELDSDERLVIDLSKEMNETTYFIQIKTKVTDDVYAVPFSF